MRSRKRTTMVNLCFQGFSVGMALLSGVALVPLYLRHIPADLYGAWQASGNVLAWMTMFDPGLATVLQQRVAAAYGRRDVAATSAWISSGLWVAAGASLLILTAGVTSSYFLASWMRLPPELDRAALAGAYRWSALGSALMVLSFSAMAANQGLQSSFGVGFISAAGALLRFLLVVLLVTSGFGLFAIAVPSVVMGLAVLVGNLVYLHARLRREKIPRILVPTRLRALAKLLSFTSLAKAASIAVNYADLFVVARYLGPDTVNTLRFTRTAPEMSRMLVDRPVAAVQPPLTHLLGAGGVASARQVVLRMFRLAVWLLALLAGGFVVFNSAFLHLWVGARFYAGAAVNLLLVAGFVASATTSVLGVWCFAAGNVTGTSLAAAVQAAIYLPLVWLGARWLGLIGVALASLASVVVVLGWYMPRAFVRLYDVSSRDRVRLLRTFAEAGLAAAVSGVVFGRAAPETWLEFGARAFAYTFCFLSALFLLSVDARAEWRGAWQALHEFVLIGWDRFRGRM